MTFRADEAARVGYEQLERFFISRQLDVDKLEKERSKQYLWDIVSKYGPVVNSYPTWHPLVSCGNHNNRAQITIPSESCGYSGLDRPQFLANGFITCTYGDGQNVIESVNAFHTNDVAIITAERLDIKLYSSSTTPILVKCTWRKPLTADGKIPLSIALPLILAKELPHLELSNHAETWESMRAYFLGTPHGSRSSLFIDQETGLAIKKVWNTLIGTGIFGTVIKE